MNKNHGIYIVLILLAISCRSFGLTTEEEASTMAVRTIEARGTSTAAVEQAVSGLLTQTAAPPTRTATPLPTEEPANTDTSTPTIIPSPTIMPSPTPSANLDDPETLANIALNEDDMDVYFESIGIDTEPLIHYRYPDGLVLYFSWEKSPHEDILTSYFIEYDTGREQSAGSRPFTPYRFFNQILVFANQEDAHDYFLEDPSRMNAVISLVDVPPIGNETIGFRGLQRDQPGSSGRESGGFCGIIWRYGEVYVLLVLDVNFEVWPSSLVGVAERIQARLEEVMD